MLIEDLRLVFLKFDDDSFEQIDIDQYNHLVSIHPEWYFIRDYQDYLSAYYEYDNCGNGVIKLVCITLNIDSV